MEYSIHKLFTWVCLMDSVCLSVPSAHVVHQQQTDPICLLSFETLPR
jgi:hypothetical protein